MYVVALELLFLFKCTSRYYHVCTGNALRSAECNAMYLFDKFNSAKFREYNDEVYYVGISRCNREYAHIYTFMLQYFRTNVLLFGKKTFVKPDVLQINHMTRNVYF